ncbi:MAG: EamA family transporter [Actinomycetota bacterium]
MTATRGSRCPPDVDPAIIRAEETSLTMWVPITLAAATFQILRTARQHQLRRVLSVNEAGFVRYVYGFPLAVVASVVTFAVVGRDLPSAPWRFWPIVAVAGLAQIGGTLALLRSFDLRDFAIGTVYAKSEVIIVAVVSAVALGEALRPLGWVAAVVCMIGVAWLAAPGRAADALRLAGDPAALMGLLAALGFAVAATGIRAASTTLEPGSGTRVVAIGDDGSVSAGPLTAVSETADSWERALVTLTVMLGVQTLVNGAQIVRSQRDQLRTVAAAWRAAIPVGVLSLAGSAAWALAVTLTSAAKVRTLGQVEVVLAFLVSAVWLREHHTRSEYLASGLVVLGVVGVVLLG